MQYLSFAYGYNSKHLIFLFYVYRIAGQIQSPPNLMFLPPHIQNMARVVAAISSFVAHSRSRRLVPLAYVCDKAEEGNEGGSENE